jgi:hypothetical protein
MPWVRETKADKKARMKPRKRPEVAEQLLKANLVDKIGNRYGLAKSWPCFLPRS